MFGTGSCGVEYSVLKLCRREGLWLLEAFPRRTLHGYGVLAVSNGVASKSRSKVSHWSNWGAGAWDPDAGFHKQGGVPNETPMYYDPYKRDSHKAASIFWKPPGLEDSENLLVLLPSPGCAPLTWLIAPCVLLLYPRGSNHMDKECLAKIMLLVPYIETQSPHHIGTWTPRVHHTVHRRDKQAPTAPCGPLHV